MPRNLCSRCQRPIKACICEFTCDIANTIEVLVLQHPSEVKQAKGSVKLLSLSLQQITVVEGENFSEHEVVAQFIARHQQSCAVLYPSEHATELSTEQLSPEPSIEDSAHTKITGIVLLDGTWKKAYKMYALSKNIQALPCISLPTDLPSHYQIRQTNKANALSTLEACLHSLIMLENNETKYLPLMNKFIEFNEFQLGFVPTNSLSARKE